MVCRTGSQELPSNYAAEFREFYCRDDSWHLVRQAGVEVRQSGTPAASGIRYISGPPNNFEGLTFSTGQLSEWRRVTTTASDGRSRGEPVVLDRIQINDAIRGFDNNSNMISLDPNNPGQIFLNSALLGQPGTPTYDARTFQSYINFFSGTCPSTNLSGEQCNAFLDTLRAVPSTTEATASTAHGSFFERVLNRAGPEFEEQLSTSLASLGITIIKIVVLGAAIGLAAYTGGRFTGRGFHDGANDSNCNVSPRDVVLDALRLFFGRPRDPNLWRRPERCPEPGNASEITGSAQAVQAPQEEEGRENPRVIAGPETSQGTTLDYSSCTGPHGLCLLGQTPTPWRAPQNSSEGWLPELSRLPIQWGAVDLFGALVGGLGRTATRFAGEAVWLTLRRL